MNGLKPKQKKFLDAFRSGKHNYLMAAGSTGSGKSIVTIGIIHLLCSNISGLRFAILRRSEKNLRQTTIPTYNKIKFMSKSTGESYITHMRAKYRTGSEILFIWADITKDPELNNIRGLELTGALMEEANQIDRKYFDALKTRIGRWGNQKCPQFIMLNLNPSAGWCKDLFYDNWVENTLPEGYYFEEFSVKDNDSLSTEYVKGLEDLPEEEYNRFVKNKWDYADIPNQLVKYEWYKNACIDNYFIRKTDRGILAIDPAWDGEDSTVFGRMHGNHIGWFEEYPKQDPGESGNLGIERAQECGISQNDTIIDAIGIGAGSVFAMRQRKFYPDLFIAGESPVLDSGFLKTFNKRAEAHWLFREGLRKEEITLTHHPKLQKQCTTITYDMTDKVIKIQPKQELKKILHESPGHLDICMMLAHKFYTTGGDLAGKILDKQIQDIQRRMPTTRAQSERLAIIQANMSGI